MMKHKCFISFKQEDEDFKLKIQNELDVDMIDKSLNDAIDSGDEEYILQKIRRDYLSDSTVTIHLIGEYSAENKGWEEQKYIKRELQASLYNGNQNTRSGILGIVLPSMEKLIYKGDYTCSQCNGSHKWVSVKDYTIAEFSYNYYLPDPKGKCYYTEDDRYCVLCTWDKFSNDPNSYIEKAFLKREHQISKKVKPHGGQR